MQPYISSGNRKMTLPTWSLPSRSTCPGCTPLCSRICYARKAERAYPEVLPCRQGNLDASRAAGFVDTMLPLVRSAAGKSGGFFRIHESGDFYSQEYLDKWIAIASALPSVRFLAFTKSFSLDFSKAPANLRIVWSVMPDTDLATVPAGPRAYAGSGAPMTAIECPGGCDSCGMCWNLAEIGRDVRFDLH